MANQDESLFIVAYAGKETADQVYDTIRDLEKDDQLDIKTAATVNRKENGKLALKHKRRVTFWKGAFGGGAIGLVLAGLTGGATAGATAVGAAIGGLIGSSRSGDRKDTKEFLDSKLGVDDSALVVLIEDAQWDVLDEATKGFGGEELMVQLTPEAQAEIEKLAADAGVASDVEHDVEVEEEVIND